MVEDHPALHRVLGVASRRAGGPADLLLQARALTVRFGGLTAVDAVDASFHAGELVGIIGPNGAGKTTFFNAISGVVAPTSGALLVGGRDLSGQGPHRFAAQGIARTFQTPRVFADMTVAANVDFGLQFAGRGRAAPPLLADGASILALIGLSQQAALPASAITPSVCIQSFFDLLEQLNRSRAPAAHGTRGSAPQRNGKHIASMIEE